VGVKEGEGGSAGSRAQNTTGADSRKKCKRPGRQKVDIDRHKDHRKRARGTGQLAAARRTKRRPCGGRLKRKSVVDSAVQMNRRGNTKGG